MVAVDVAPPWTIWSVSSAAWTAFGTLVLATLTVVIAVVALFQFRAGRRLAVQHRRADALERGAQLHIERFDRRDATLALRSIGDHSFLRVHVKWIHPSGEIETLEPDSFTVSPGSAGESIGTVELPAQLNWPPTLFVTFSDVIGYRFCVDYEGNLSIIEEPHDIKVQPAPNP